MNRTEPRVKGYSLWFMPEGSLFEKLKKSIDDLSIQYSTKPFLPHITLIGQVTESRDFVIEKTAELASALDTFEINLEGIGSKDEYFRCLYLEARKSSFLMNANHKARLLFGREGEAEFMPHLSLLYGFLPEEEKKEIGTKVSCLYTSFSIDSLHLYSTSGGPEDWFKIEEFPTG